MPAIDDGRYLISEFRIFAPVLEGAMPGSMAPGVGRQLSANVPVR